MSDNELDNLFKEAAEGFKPPNDPSAWQDMARKLDGAGVATSFWNWKTISSTVLVGVAVLGVIFYLSMSDSTSLMNPNSEMISSSESPKTTNEPAKTTAVEKAAKENKSSDDKQETTSAAQSLPNKNNQQGETSSDDKTEKSLIDHSTQAIPSGKQERNALKEKNSMDPQTKTAQQNTQSAKASDNGSAKALENKNDDAAATNSVTKKTNSNKSAAAAAVGALVVTEKVVPATSSPSKGGEVASHAATSKNVSKSQHGSGEEKTIAPGDEKLTGGNEKTVDDGKAATLATVVAAKKAGESATSGSVVSNEGQSKQVASTSSDSKTPVSIANELPKKQNGGVAVETAVAVVATDKALESNHAGSVAAADGNTKQALSGTAGANTQPIVAAADSVKKTDELKEESLPKELTEKDKSEVKEEKSSFNRLALKLTVAPDYSTVKSATPNGLGINYGMLIEYRITKHLSVATGGIWSKKIYSANDVMYSGYHADWVDGDCRMWDIPINVYYNFTSNKPFSFYASAGLSSYIMNEENYVYYVETPYGTRNYPKQIKGENNEWFKTLNVSVGMQFRMSQQFSLQFEPTLKAPLAGVGEGEVSLVSLGAFFNLRYEIPFNKRSRNED